MCFLKLLYTVSAVAACGIISASTSTCTTGDIRLIGGSVPSEGRVEICYNQVWGTICDRSWDHQEATVVCQQLELPALGAVAWSNAHFGRGIGQIWLDNLRCTGSEVSLLTCQHDGIGVHASYCGHDDDVGVECSAAVSSNCSNGDVRLVDGSNELEGRVEVCYNQSWGTVCDDLWDRTDADVVCRQLGLSPYGLSIAYTSSHFGGGKGGIFLDYVYCTSSALRLIDCTRYSGIGVHNCDHTDNAGVKCQPHPEKDNCTDGDVRLRGGSSEREGRVEICMNQIWGTICDSSWNSQDADVACKQLGFPTLGASIRVNAYFGEGSGPIWLDDLRCTGSENSLLKCPHDGVGVYGYSCGHDDDVGVECPAVSANTNCSDGDIRLVDGTNELEGRVEVCYNNQWGTVCDDSWSSADAIVACKQLGYYHYGATAYSYSYFGGGTGGVFLDDLYCTGSESRLIDCGHRGIGVHKCDHTDDAGVRCQDVMVTNCFHGEVRLMNGLTVFEGRVELCVYGVWGTVCHKSWTANDATVVCRQLGYRTAGVQVFSYAYFGPGTGPVHISYVGCSSSEQKLLHCSFSGFDNTDCSHSYDAGVRCTTSTSTCTTGDIRLVGGSVPSEGRVEICYNQEWGTICGRGWDHLEATVVCQQLGLPFLGAVAMSDAHFGQGIGKIWLDNLHCTGSESNLLNCTHNGIGNIFIYCGHDNDVGVECLAGSALPERSNCTNGEVELRGGSSEREGRVEICINETWGTICDSSWDSLDADVVCKQLGYLSLGSISRINAYFGRGSGPIWLDKLRCIGNESSLLNCIHDGIEVYSVYCGHGDDVGVECPAVSANSSCSDGYIRLVGGANELEGRVEVCYNNQWGSVCSHSWSNINYASVVCKQAGYYPFGGIFLDNVQCNGDEARLVDCGHRGIGLHNCDHTEEAGVRCQDVMITNCTHGEVRLVNGLAIYEGRVEVCVAGVWGTVCHNSWDSSDATVVCRQLGYPTTGIHGFSYSYFGMGIGPVHVSNVECIGTEQELLNCSFHGFDNTDCSHSDDAGVSCIASSRICTTGDIRLVGGSVSSEGRVEICYNQAWGTICDSTWDHLDANVACQQLGFRSLGAVAWSNAHFGQGIGHIWFGDLRCTGRESTLLNCKYDGVGAHDYYCGHDHDAGVECQAAVPSNCSNGDVRLVDGSNELEGRVEVCYNQSWGTVCDDSWDRTDADVVCRQLGLSPYRGSIAYGNSYFGRGKGDIFLDDVSCTSSALRLMDCGHSGIGVHNCDHTDDAGVKCQEIFNNCTNGEIELHGGSSEREGTVEICINQIWGTVCDSSWDNQDAVVVCKQLGFPTLGAISQTNAYFGEGSGPIWLDDLRCTGSENTLLNCPHDGVGVYGTYCGHDDDVGVECPAVSPNTNCSDGDIRLVDGTNELEGRVEVCYNNQWGTVCDDSWSSADAIVACKQLGYYHYGATAYSYSYFGGGTGGVFLDNVNCDGDESRLIDCGHSDIGVHNCDHTADAGVRCQDVIVTNCSHGEVRLVNGLTIFEGRVELCVNGVWGTVCHKSWAASDANVVCRQLGYLTAGVQVFNYAYFGPGTGPVHISYVGCSSSEQKLLHCSFSGFDNTDCSHSYDAGVRCTTSTSTCTTGDIRLVGGSVPSEGRVEICHKQVWGTICDSSWDSLDATVVCQQLGFPSLGALAWSNAHFGRGIGQIWLDNLRCTGSEVSLLTCQHDGLGVHASYCGHDDDVGVECPAAAAVPSNCSNGDVRLVDGSNELEGRVEVCYNQSWGTVCADSWDRTDADVVCRQLGLSPYGLSIAYTSSHFGGGNGGIFLDDVYCTSSALRLIDCRHRGIGVHNCDHTNDAGVKCQPLSKKSNCTTGEIRLQGGSNEREGRVELCINHVWGTICGLSWNSQDADVVCKQLGYPSLGAIGLIQSVHSENSRPIWLDDLRCIGTESSLLNCTHDGIGVYFRYFCGHDDAIGVECPVVSANTNCSDGDIRLVGGASELEGRVEMCYNSQWGTVCDDSWSSIDATVACKQLGYYPYGANAYTFGGGMGGIYLDNVQCTGDESRLIDCRHDGIGVHDCDHTADAGVRCPDVMITNCTHGEVRLVNGLTIYEGRVELCVYGVWGTVCHKSWSLSDVTVVCRQLGYPMSGIYAFSYAYFGLGTGPVHISNVECSGTEQELLNCSFSGFDNTDCSHSDDAGVKCTTLQNICSNGDVRLVGGLVPSEGRVEICYNHVWGTICGRSWDSPDATVVCQQLGFPSLGAVVWPNTHFDQGIGQIWLDYISCTGSESSLLNCTHNGIGVYASNCSHDNDVGVKCPTVPIVIPKIDHEAFGIQGETSNLEFAIQQASPQVKLEDRSWTYSNATSGELVLDITELDSTRFTLATDRLSLMISVVDLFDSGVYTLTVKTLAGLLSANISFKVLVQPQLIKHISGETIIHEEGDSVIFNCTGDGIPVPDIIWTLNGRSIALNPRFTTEESVTVGYRLNIPQARQSSLTIQNLTLQDAGHCACRADNGAGQPDVISFTLNVTKKSPSGAYNVLAASLSPVLVLGVISLVIVLLLAFTVFRTIHIQKKRKANEDININEQQKPADAAEHVYDKIDDLKPEYANQLENGHDGHSSDTVQVDRGYDEVRGQVMEDNTLPIGDKHTYERVPTQMYESVPPQIYERAPTQTYESVPTQMYESVPTQTYESVSTQHYERIPSHL